MSQQEDIDKCIEEVNKPVEDIKVNDWVCNAKIFGKENIKILRWQSDINRRQLLYGEKDYFIARKDIILTIPKPILSSRRKSSTSIFHHVMYSR